MAIGWTTTLSADACAGADPIIVIAATSPAITRTLVLDMSPSLQSTNCPSNTGRRR
jgi:hypothetical protein